MGLMELQERNLFPRHFEFRRSLCNLIRPKPWLFVLHISSANRPRRARELANPGVCLMRFDSA